MTDYIPGIDVSRHNGAIDYRKCASVGVKFAAIRCTVGDYYTDPCFAANWDGFRAAGIPVTAYHVVVPADSTGRIVPANTQIERMLSTLAGRQPDLPLVLDCELSGGQKPPTISAMILGCSRLLLGSGGFSYPLIYTRKTWWDANMQPNPVWKLHPLWVAHYTNADRPWLPRDWDDFQVWQHSNKGDGPVYGSEEDHIDLNRARRDFIQSSPPEPLAKLSAAIQVTINDQLYTGETILRYHAKAQRGKERKEEI